MAERHMHYPGLPGEQCSQVPAGSITVKDGKRLDFTGRLV
jgi:hypothetical protein